MSLREEHFVEVFYAAPYASRERELGENLTKRMPLFSDEVPLPCCLYQKWFPAEW